MDSVTTPNSFQYSDGDRVRMKKDLFYREREKTARLLDIRCAKCDSKVLLYQKDGRGALHRCYLNRIVDPPHYAGLQKEAGLTKEKMPLLKCPNCGTVIGYPMLHREGRLAYFFIAGGWKAVISKVRILD